MTCWRKQTSPPTRAPARTRAQSGYLGCPEGKQLISRTEAQAEVVLLFVCFSSPRHRLKCRIIIPHHACAFTAEQTHEYANERPLSFCLGRTTQSALIAQLLTHTHNTSLTSPPRRKHARTEPFHPRSPARPRAVLQHGIM